jgi:predicted nuclease of predicted toxin-antitoxin system
MRFLADMGVSTRVTEWLATAGHDVIHLRDEGLSRLPNGEIFQKGFTEQRIVLTFDLDFGEIVAASAGQIVSVILFRLHDARSERVIERLNTVLAQSSADLLRGAIIVVEDARHRVRSLPIGSSRDAIREQP